MGYKFSKEVILFSALAILVLPKYSFSGTCWNGGKSGTAPWYVKNSSGADSVARADVNACINTHAADGDTVYVPAGSATWANTINISKGITVIGAGINNTIITSNTQAYMVTYSGKSGNNPTFRWSGFTMNGNNQSQIINLSCPAASPANTNIRIDHNKFTNPTMANASRDPNRFTAMENTGCRGVFDHNYVEKFRAVIRFWAANETWEWNTYGPLEYGTLNDNFYLEDNYISGTGINDDYMVSDCGEGGRFVYRYNTFDNIKVGQMFDIHGGGGYLSFGGEIYGNNMINSTDPYSITEWRGGRLASFYNRFSSGNFHAYNNDGCPSDLTTMHNSGVIFGNRRTMTGALISMTTSADTCGATSPIAEGGDYISDTGGNIMKGNTLPATCTTGTGHWLTTQSTTSLSGLVGDIMTNPTRGIITGTFYRCTATNTWTASFSPMTYPHPLTTGESPPPPPPLLIPNPPNILFVE